MLKVSVAVVAMMVMLGLTSWGRIGHENGGRIVLPNSKLLGCRSSGCFQLWQDEPAQADAIYPRQVIIDIFGNDRRPRRILALYEKSVSTDDRKATLDQRCVKCTLAVLVTF